MQKKQCAFIEKPKGDFGIMKKLFVLLLMLAAILTLVACGSSNEKEDQGEDQNADQDITSPLKENAVYSLNTWGIEYTDYSDFYALIGLPIDPHTNTNLQCSATVEGEQMTILISYDETIPAVGYNSYYYWVLEEPVTATYFEKFVFDIEKIENNTVHLKFEGTNEYKYSYTGKDAEQFIDIITNRNKTEQLQQMYPDQYDVYEKEYQDIAAPHRGEWVTSSSAEDISIVATADNDNMQLSLDSITKLYDENLYMRSQYAKQSVQYKYENGKLLQICYEEIEKDYQGINYTTTEHKSDYFYDENGKYCVKAVHYTDGEPDGVSHYERDFFANGTRKTETRYIDNILASVIEFYEDGNCKKESSYIQGEFVRITEFEYDANGGYSFIEYDGSGNKVYEGVYNSYGNPTLEIQYADEYCEYVKREYRYDQYEGLVYECTWNEKNQKINEKELVYYNVGNRTLHDNYFVSLNAEWDSEGNLVNYSKIEYVFGDGRIQKKTSFDQNGVLKSYAEYDEQSRLTVNEYYSMIDQSYRRELFTDISDTSRRMVSYLKIDDEWCINEEILYYTDLRGYNYSVTEKTYYKNGNLKSEVILGDDYEILEEIFYNEDGTIMEKQ